MHLKDVTEIIREIIKERDKHPPTCKYRKHIRAGLRMLEDQLEWRKTEDELPVGSDQVLCVVNGKHGNLTFQNAVTIGAYYPKEGWCLEAWPEWETPGVTHWMPLPEPPKEEA